MDIAYNHQLIILQFHKEQLHFVRMERTALAKAEEAPAHTTEEWPDGINIIQIEHTEKQNTISEPSNPNEMF